MKKLTAATCLCLLFSVAKANSFTVTSNADAGTGTFREALTLAAANGTAVVDTIQFNLADQSLAGRTISYESQLPDLSSRLVIDGTTQPGAPIGVSNARVVLQPKLTYLYIGLVMLRASQVEIYGLCFTGIRNDPNVSFTGAIYGYAVSDIIIGKPGKGNLFYNCGLGVHFSGLYSNRDSLNKRLTVQGNIFGLINDGETTISNSSDALFENSTDVLVGGDTEREANYFTAWQEGVKLFSFNYSKAPFTDAGFFRVKGNYFGLSYVSRKSIATTQAISVMGWLLPTNVSLDIQHNDLRYSSILLQRLASRFSIRGNRIRVIWMNWCASGIIGGPGDERNFIGSNTQNAAVNVYECGPVTITRNAIFCNPKGISLVQATKPKIAIRDISATAVKGTADPLASIEVFGLDTCTGQCENGTVFLGATQADAAGNWALPSIFQGVISATATLPAGATSEFAGLRLNLDHLAVQYPTCGNLNGSIKGAVLESGTGVYWEDQNGKVVGTSPDLTGIGPGRYRLVAKMGNGGCQAASPYYFVYDTPRPQLTAADLILTNPACGLSNGKIEYADGANYDWQYRWSRNGILFDTSNAAVLTGLAPGSYSVVVRLKADTLCAQEFGGFVLTNQGGPVLNTGALVIAPAVCGKNNGSIKGLAASNIIGTAHLCWVDSANKIVGTGYDLQNVAPGKYRFKIKDDGGCDTLITSFYRVDRAGLITIDTSNKMIRPAACAGNTGSIQHITVTGGTAYAWKNTGTGVTVGAGISATGLAAGVYQLSVTNNFGCTEISPVLAVPQANFAPISVQSWNSKPAGCGLPNGSVDLQTFSGDTALYSFRWVDSASNRNMSASTRLSNLTGGAYTLFARDTNGCEQAVFKTTVADLPIPVFDYTNLQITPDQCMRSQGAIRNLAVKNLTGGGGKLSWANTGNAVGSSLDLLNIPQGNYVLTVTDAAGCTVVSKPVVVANRNVTLDAPQYNEQTILKNNAATLTIKNYQPGLYRLYGEPLATTPVQENSSGNFLTPLLSADTKFYVRYVNGVCQSDLVGIWVKVIEKTAIYVPTAFSPNGDGRNDLLKVMTHGKIKLGNFSVYNRWGQLVFATSDSGKGWDGTIQGKPAETGVYVSLSMK